MSNKKLKETEYSIKKDEMPEVMPQLEPTLKPEDKVEITNEGDLNEALKIDPYDILHSMGIDIISKSPQEKIEIYKILKQFVDIFKQKGYTNVVLESKDDEDTSEIDSLYSGADSRAIEYGIQQEDFDKLMEDLKKRNTPKIKINENVKPRIKKSDLIEYIKTKRNVK